MGASALRDQAGLLGEGVTHAGAVDPERAGRHADRLAAVAVNAADLVVPESVTAPGERSVPTSYGSFYLDDTSASSGAVSQHFHDEGLGLRGAFTVYAREKEEPRGVVTFSYPPGLPPVQRRFDTMDEAGMELVKDPFYLSAFAQIALWAAQRDASWQQGVAAEAADMRGL
jgi:hypothetical protein